MTEKKLIHFNSDSDYLNLKNDIDGSSIVFVKDSHKIVTHGAEYLFLGWSILEEIPKLSNGVYIMDLEGVIHEVDAWDQGNNATGVVLITDNISIIVASQNWNKLDGPWNGYSYPTWLSNPYTVPGCYTTLNREDALKDFSGKINTNAIIASNTTSSAVLYCKSYSKGCKGIGEWYLPAAGEYNLIIQNSKTVNAALQKLGGEKLSNDYYAITSTLYNDDRYWRYDSTTASFSGGLKNSSTGSAAVRPVCTLN